MFNLSLYRRSTDKTTKALSAPAAFPDLSEEIVEKSTNTLNPLIYSRSQKSLHTLINESAKTWAQLALLLVKKTFLLNPD